MRKEKAVLTVEASLTLTLFMFFVMFLLSFNRVYSAQNTVSHATLQTADAVSAESMLRANASAENIADLLTVSNHIYAGESIPASALEKLTNGNVSEIAKRDFIAAIAETESEADAVLKKYGVKDGLAGIDFSGCSYNADTGETIIFVRYTVELQFPIIGFKEFPMTKAAKVNNMGKETYTITVVSENPEMGTTSGTVKVRKGESAVIAAYPNYGCVFTGWREGGSENPKTLTNVNCDMTFTALFDKRDYSVIAKVNNPNYGKAFANKTTFKLNETAIIKATPNYGYKFLGWDEDGNGRVDSGEPTDPELRIKVRRAVVVTAIFEPKMCRVQVNVNKPSYGTAKIDGKTDYIDVKFGSTIRIVASISNTKLYEFEKWTSNSSRDPRLGSNMTLNYTVRTEGTTVVTANFKDKIKPKISINPSSSPFPNYAEYCYKSFTLDEACTKLPTMIKTYKLKADINVAATVSWTSSDKNVASVDGNGNVTAKNPGTATITAKITYNGTTVSATRTVTVCAAYETYCYRDAKLNRHYESDAVSRNDVKRKKLGYDHKVKWKNKLVEFGCHYRYALTTKSYPEVKVNKGSSANGYHGKMYWCTQSKAPDPHPDVCMDGYAYDYATYVFFGNGENCYYPFYYKGITIQSIR